nr:protein AHNAK2 [Maylandia zebra]
MCDCFHLAFPNWHAASSGTRPGRRLQGPEPATEDSMCDEPSQFAESERPRPQGSSPVEEYPETEKYSDSDKECEAEHDPRHKGGTGKKTKKSGLGSMFEKRSTPKMSKLKEAESPESEVIVKTAKDGCAEGLIYGGGGKEGIFIKEVVPESPASKNLKLKEGDQILSATVYFDNMSYEDAIQILEHAQAYKLKLCLKRKPEITETEPAIESDVIPEEDLHTPQMREQGKTKRRGEARISWPKFSSFGKGRKSRFTRSHSSSEAEEQRKLELSPTTSDTESPIKTQDALKYKKKHKIKLPGLTKRGRISSSEEQDTDVQTGQISGDTHHTQESDMLSPECLESPSGEMPEAYVKKDLKVMKDVQLEETNLTVREAQPIQHKVELISIDSTLKTADLTVALADQESPSLIKSPEGKKKKKERSELKMKILGKDKSHKKEAKAKSSPKRLKTLGASFDLADHPENEKSDLIPNFESHTEDPALYAKVEHDLSDVAVSQKNPQKSEAKRQKGKEIQEKHEDRRTGETVKLTKLSWGDVGAEEITDDPYKRLAKSSDFRTQLPKREEIEIPAKRGHNKRRKAEFLREVTTSKDEIKKEKGQSEGVVCEVVIPELDSIEYIDSVDGSPAKKDNGIRLTGFDVNLESKTNVDISLAKSAETEEHAVKLPQFGAITTYISVNVPDGDKPINTDEAETKTLEREGKGSKFKVPNVGISMPRAKGIKTDSSLSKKGVAVTPPPETDVTLGSVDVCIAERIMEAEKYDQEIKHPRAEGDFDRQGGKFKMPKLGIAMPKIKGSEFDFSASEKNEDMKLSETKRKVKPSDAEIRAPEMKVVEKYVDESPSKFKMPTFKLPKFGSPVANTSHEVHDKLKDIEICETQLKSTEGVNVNIPTPNTDIVGSSIDVKTVDVKPQTGIKTKIDVSLGSAEAFFPQEKTGDETEVHESKFKLPKFGITMPKVKGPEVDFNLLKRDVDETLEEAKTDAERKKPSAQMETEDPDIEDLTKDNENSLSKFKMPTFKLPKFGVGIPSATTEIPDLDTGIKIEGADISIPEQVLEVNIAAPSIELKEHEGKGSKFKLPSLGFSVPQTKGPDFDLNSSKKSIDITLPEAEVKLPDVEVEKNSAEVEMKIETKEKKESLSKVKMPTFHLPKLGIGITSATAKVPDMDKCIKIDGADISIPEEVLEVNIAAPSTELKEPSISLKTSGYEHEVKGSKFKLPSLGFSVHQDKAPDIDLSSSKQDVHITLPEATAEVKLHDVEVEKPSVETEIEAPEFKVETKDKKGSPSKFKMPPFQLPKFGIGITSATAEVPDMEKGIKIEGADIEIPEEVLEVNIAAPSTELKELPISLETSESEYDGKGSKFKLPSLGLSVPKRKGPDTDLSLSKKDVDVTLPEAKAKVTLPDMEVETEAPEFKVETKDKKGSPSKFKMPTFKLPKFGARDTSATAEVPDMDKGIKIDGGDISIPEEVLEVNIAAPSTEFKEPSLTLKTTGAEREGKGSKFKLPSLGLSVPETKVPDIDLSLSKKDVDVTYPEAKAEAKLPDFEVEKPSVEVETEAPEFKVETKDKKGSPSKFKMPTFKLPKFGIGIPSATAKVPDLDTDVKVDGGDISIPEEVLEVNIAAPSTEFKEPSLTLKTAGAEHEGKGSKFKLPSLGLSVPQAKGPDIDLSLSEKDVEVTLPEANAEVKLRDVEIEKSSVEVEIEAPEIKIETKGKKGSPSKFKMPTFQLPKFGVGITSTTAEVPDMEKGIKIDGADIEIPEEVLEVNIAAPSTEFKEPSLTLKTAGAEHEVKGSKFKLPSLGLSVPKTKGSDIDLSLSKKDVKVTLQEDKAEVKLPDVEVEKPSVEVEIEAPEIKIETKGKKGSPSKFKMPTFQFPKFGVGVTSATAEVPDMDKGIKIDGADIKIPEEVLEVGVAAPSTELKEPSISLKTSGYEHEVKGSKFTLPSLGLSVPKTKGPDIDLSLSKKDVHVTLPEAKAEVKLPDVEVEKPSVEVEIEAPEFKVETKDKKGSPSKFKMPTFKLPRFGIGIPSGTAKVPDLDTDVKVEGADISIPKEVLEVNIAAPSTEFKEPSLTLKTTGAEHEGKGSKFKLPSLGLSVPQAKGPDINLSLSEKDVDITLPEAKAEVKLPDVEVEKPSVEVEIEAPEIKIETKGKKGSPSKFKMPTFQLPKFGVGVTSATAEVPDMDKGIKIDGADIEIPEEVLEVNIAAPSTELKEPSISLKTSGSEHEGKGSKFKLPSLGLSVTKTKGPDIDLSLSKKDVDAALPEAKAEIKLPDVEVEKPSVEVEIEAPEFKVETKDKKGSPSKFKMPTFKLPRFGIGIPSATAKVPDLDTDVKVDGGDMSIPEEVLKVNIAAPSTEFKEPSLTLKTTGAEHEGKGSKFKLPSLGLSVPQAKGPDINLSLSKKDVDVTLPEAKAEVKLRDVEIEKPSVEVEIEAPEIKIETKGKKGSPSKFKMPTFQLPKFGVGVTSATAEVPDMDKGIKIDGADIKIPEEVLEVGVAAPSTELKEPSISLKTSGSEHEGKGSKFKLPSLGLSVPKTKGPDIDLSLTKKDVDAALPEAKAEVKLPDVEVEKPSVEIEAPEFKVETKDKKDHHQNLRSKVPDLDTDVKVDGGDISIPEEVLEVNIAAPSTEFKEPSLTLKTAGAEHEGKGSKFKLPSLGLSVPQAKGPDIDLSLSKKDVDVTLPEAKAEVKLRDVEIEKPCVEVEIEAPEIKTETKGKKGSPSKFKMPTFQIPKFGVGVTSATAEVPDMDKGIKIDGADIKIPEEVLEVGVAAPSTELKEPSISLKTSGYEHEGKGSKFKLPSLGLSVPQAKGPDINLSLSEKDVDITLPEAKAEVKLPDVEVEKPSVEVEIEAPEIKIETKGKKGSPSKFKMPTFQLPKFGVGVTSATAEVPDMDKGIKIDGADIEIPEEVLEVNIAAPSTELKEPSISLKTTSLGLSVAKTKGPDIDLSLTKKDVDAALPEAKAEIKLPDVEVEKPSVEIEAPEFKVETKDKKGSPSKFKMPTFKLPRFGIGIPSGTAKVSDLDTDVKVDGADISIPEEVLEVNIAAPSTEFKEPSLTLKTAGAEHEGKGSKFKLPSLGLSVPQAKGPDIDLSLSKKDVDVTLPEAKAEVKLRDVEIEKPCVEVEIEAPEIKTETKGKKGSPSKFKMPTFQIPKFGVGVTSATAEVPDMDKGIKIDGADIKIPEEVLEVGVAAPSTELKEPSISLKTSGYEHEGKGSKFKLPSLGLSVPQAKGPDINLSLSKKDVNITLPEAKAEVKLPDVEVEKPSVEVEIEAPEIKIETKGKKGSPSKFKMPTFQLPKFGVGVTSSTAEVPDMDKGIKIDGADIEIPEEVLEVNIAAPSTELKEPSISLKTSGYEHECNSRGTGYGQRHKIDGADIEIPEEVLEVNIAAPSTELKEPSISLKTSGSEHEGKGSKFKLPSLGLSVPKTKGPDIDLSLSKKDVDAALPEAKAEIKLPDVEVEKPSVEVEIEAPEFKVETKDKKGSPSKFKMPTFRLPRFGIGIPSATAKVPDLDTDVKVDGGDMSIPEEVLKVNIAAPSTEFKEPSLTLKTTGAEHEGKGSKFKLPSLGLSVPQAKGPDINLSLSKKDVDVTLPEAKAEVKLRDVEIEKPCVEVEIEAPEIKIETKGKKGSPSKFKMPTFQIPKFGVGVTSATAEVPDMDKGIKIDGADIEIPEEVLEVGVAAPSTELKEPSISLKTSGSEHEGKGSKFKLPSLGLSVPKTKGPDIDLSLTKKDVDAALPEAKAEIKLPDVEVEKPSVEIEAPEFKVETKDKKGSPSKFKMPTFKLPRFGIGIPSGTAKVPDLDTDVKVDGGDISIPEEVLEVNIAAPSTEFKEPSLTLKTAGAEHEGKGSKFKLPSLGLSVPQAKGPDIDLSLSKKDVDVTLPEAKAEVKLRDVEIEKPCVEVEIEAPEIKTETKGKKGSPSKFKMPTFQIPKFGVGVTSATAEVPDMDKGIKIDGADIKIPEEVLEVGVAAPSTELKEPSISLKTSGYEHEVKGSKFTLPSLGLSVPKTKGPDIDLSLSKKDVHVTLPEAKAEVKLPDVEVEKPSVEVEIEAPEFKVETKDKKGSPSKFKMPTFKLPRFGIGIPSGTAKVSDLDTDVKVDGADISIPEEVLEVNIAAPSTEFKEPSLTLKTAGAEHEGKGSKFKLPSLGLSVPQTKGPDIDLSLSKKDVDVTLPEAKAEVKLPDVEIEKPSVEVGIEAPEIKIETKGKKGSPSKFKMPTFQIPKFGVGVTSSTAEAPDMDKGMKIDGADIEIPEEVLEVGVAVPSTELKEPSISLKTSGYEHEVKGSKFKLPSLGLSFPQTKGPDIDLSLSKKDVDVTVPKAKADKAGKAPEEDISIDVPGVDVILPEVKTDVHLPDTDLKESSHIIIEGGTDTNLEAKLKKPRFSLPKFSFSKQSVKDPEVDISLPKTDVIFLQGDIVKQPDNEFSMEVSDVNKGIKIDAAPGIDSEGLAVDVKAKGGEISGSKFKMPNLAISMTKVKSPETDLSLSKKDVDISLPEVTADIKLLHIEGKETEGSTSLPETPTNEAEVKSKRPSWTFPKFSFSRTADKAPAIDVKIETPKAESISSKTEVCLAEAEIKGPSMEEPPAEETETNLKKPKFSLPRFSFSKSSIKESELSDELPQADVSVSEGEIKVKQPEMEIKAPEKEAGQGSPFKFPNLGIVQTKPKGPEVDLKSSINNVDSKRPEIKAEVKISEEVKQSSSSLGIKSSETKAKSKDAEGSPLKEKISPLKMPKFSSASFDVTMEAPKTGKVIDIHGSKPKEDISVTDKDSIVNIKMDYSKGIISESETPKTETDVVGLPSPSKFKLPSFKMPRLSFSKSKPEEEQLPAEIEDKEAQLEMEVETKGESKSPKMILTSFGEILKTIDVEFDVPKADQVEENLVVSKEVQEIGEHAGKQLEAKEKGTSTIQDISKSPERTGWFKFPKFGLSSPSEAPSAPEKCEQKDEKSPVGGMGDEEISPTFSVQSSDAFADISSAVTSEHVGPSISSPTKVTVKYSDPNVATELEETHSNIFTSATRTELISVQPNLPEKITILSSGISSSSEDTCRLESRKLHVITTNIQATPEAQHAQLLTDIEAELAEGLPLKSEANETTSWTVEGSDSGNRAVFERHLVTKTSTERSESRETIVITKQITHVFDSSEPISGETASSIQRLRDSVHSEKMRFFDDAEK